MLAAISGAVARCTSCDLLSIDGVLFHEPGCPNLTARWDGESWIKQRECFECGCIVDADDACCLAEPEEEEYPEPFPL